MSAPRNPLVDDSDADEEENDVEVISRILNKRRQDCMLISVDKIEGILNQYWKLLKEPPAESEPRERFIYLLKYCFELTSNEQVKAAKRRKTYNVLLNILQDLDAELGVNRSRQNGAANRGTNDSAADKPSDDGATTVATEASSKLGAKAVTNEAAQSSSNAQIAGHPKVAAGKQNGQQKPSQPMGKEGNGTALATATTREPHPPNVPSSETQTTSTAKGPSADHRLLANVATDPAMEVRENKTQITSQTMNTVPNQDDKHASCPLHTSTSEPQSSLDKKGATQDSNKTTAKASNSIGTALQQPGPIAHLGGGSSSRSKPTVSANQGSYSAMASQPPNIDRGSYAALAMPPQPPCGVSQNVSNIPGAQPAGRGGGRGTTLPAWMADDQCANPSQTPPPTANPPQASLSSPQPANPLQPTQRREFSTQASSDFLPPKNGVSNHISNGKNVFNGFLSGGTTAKTTTGAESSANPKKASELIPPAAPSSDIRVSDRPPISAPSRTLPSPSREPSPAAKHFLSSPFYAQLNKSQQVSMTLQPDVTRSHNIPLHSYRRHERPQRVSVKLQRPALSSALVESLDKRICMWEPFYKPLAYAAMGVTSAVSTCEPMPMPDASIRTGTQFCIDLSVMKKDRSVPDFHKLKWGKATERGGVALMLMMFPVERTKYDTDKRADCHLWPKGTFLQLQGSPTMLRQRKQQSHDESEWKSICYPLDITEIRNSSPQFLKVDIGCYDKQEFAYCVGLFSYFGSDKIYRDLMKSGPHSESLRRLPREEAMTMATQIAEQQVVTLDLDDDENAEPVMGKIVVSLMCPISKQLMETPVRSVSCKHFQCFDLRNYIVTNEGPSGSRWRCGACDPRFVSLSELQICGLTFDLINEFAETASPFRDRVEVNEDRSYRLLNEKKRRNRIKNLPGNQAPAKRTKIVEEIILD